MTSKTSYERTAEEGSDLLLAEAVDRYKEAVQKLFLRRMEGPLSDVEEARIAEEHERLWRNLPASAHRDIEVWIEQQKDILA